jgi:hypothetical protein
MVSREEVQGWDVVSFRKSDFFPMAAEVVQSSVLRGTEIFAGVGVGAGTV